MEEGGGIAWRLLFSFSTMTFQFSYCRVSVLFPFLFTACLLPRASCLMRFHLILVACITHTHTLTHAHTHTYFFDFNCISIAQAVALGWAGQGGGGLPRGHRHSTSIIQL